ncbi:hypothetical protein F441_22947 [Phytophthora nicotianae CJ01A1]|uniref:Uncharacterized protein n=1 Tax=Phytophthora nicotianae CJ01A1 TaxID=1317063 RepID=W2VMP6_PHYNI|nr:hypothetical protein F441_22947 [Phytophthora nicotianae CJ01A1]
MFSGGDSVSSGTRGVMPTTMCRMYFATWQSALSANWSELLATTDEIKKHNEERVVDGYFTYKLECIQLCIGTTPVSREPPDVALSMLELPDLAISELQLALEQELQIGFFRLGEVHPSDLTAQCHCVDDQIFSGLCASLVDASRVHKLTINGAFRSLTPAQCTSVNVKQSSTSLNSVSTLETAEDFVYRLLQIDEENGRFNVLVPGRGNGVIPSDQAHKVLPEASCSAGLKSLYLSIDSNAEQEMLVLLRFLQLVEFSLQKLSIQMGVATAFDVQAILKACPRLDQLYLDNTHIGDGCFDARRGEGKCNYPRLGPYILQPTCRRCHSFCEEIGRSK